MVKAGKVKAMKQRMNQIKIRKAKGNPDKRKRLRKDLGVPDMSILANKLDRRLELQQEKEIIRKLQRQEKDEKELEKQRALLEAQREKKERRRQAVTMEQLMKANTRQDDFTHRETTERDKDDQVLGIPKDGSKRQFYNKFRKVVDEADIILEVLDARDPLGCRCLPAESLVATKGKKLILVMNKVDLVPTEVAEKWRKILQSEYPTIPLQAEGANANRRVRGEHVLSTVEDLLQLLKNYTRSGTQHVAATVGVIGYPNVGKSSLINAMKGSKAVGVSATPGFTKTTAAVRLDKNLMLMDCPGIVFDAEDKSVALRNCVNVDLLADPVGVAEEIIARCPAVLERYGVAAAWPAQPADVLRSVAIARGKVKAAGVADLDAAAKLIIREWNSGVLPYWVEPPRKVIESTLVTELAPRFAADEQDAVVVRQHDVTVEEGLMQRQRASDAEEEEEEEEDMEERDGEERRKRGNRRGNDEDEMDTENGGNDEEDAIDLVQLMKHKNQTMEQRLNPQENKWIKKQWKKQQKKKRRQLKTEY